MSKIGMIILCLVIIVFGLFYAIPGLKNRILTGTFQTSSQKAESDKFSTWEEFVPQSGLFKVRLPHAPQYAKDFIPISNSDKMRRYDMYASEDIDGTLFLISVITYPDVIEDSLTEDVLHQTIDELMKSNADNHLKRVEREIFNMQNALNFSIENRDFLVEGKLMTVGKRIFVLSYVSLAENFDLLEYQHFVDSFKFLTIKSD